MKLSQAFKMAFKSIWAKKTRSALTMLGIIIGVASVMILVTTVNGSNQMMKDYYESMGTNTINIYAYSWNNNRASKAIYDYCLQLDHLVDGVTPNAWAWGDVRYADRSSRYMDYAPESYLGNDQWAICNGFSIAHGRDLSQIDLDNYAQVCVLGSRAKELLFNYADPIGETITFNGLPFTVVGVYAQKDFTGDPWSRDNVILFPYTLSMAMTGQEIQGEYIAKAKSSSTTTEAMALIGGFLKGLVGDNGYYSVYSSNTWQEQNNEQSAMMAAVLGGISAVSLLVAGIGIMNIMLVTVTERTREIGIRKAIGAERSSILVQFLIEAAMICAIGGIVGILVGYYGSVVFGTQLMEMLQLPGMYYGSMKTYITPTLQITLGSFGFSVLMGLGFGTYPAIKASGLQPVDALRAE